MPFPGSVLFNAFYKSKYMIALEIDHVKRINTAKTALSTVHCICSQAD
jgi:hypothetical protein